MLLPVSESAEAELKRAVSHRVMAAMETGNHGEARTMMQEFDDVDPASAQDLRMDVLTAYGIGL